MHTQQEVRAERRLTRTTQLALLVALVCVTATQVQAQAQAQAQAQVPDWQLRARVEMRPLSRGECAFVSLFVKNARGKLITRPDGSTIGPADFELTVSGPGAASFKWERNTPDNYRVCATFTTGPDRADIVITYPRTAMPDDAVYPGVAFKALLPVFRGDGGATPDFSLLPLTGATASTTLAIQVPPAGAPPPSVLTTVPARATPLSSARIVQQDLPPSMMLGAISVPGATMTRPAVIGRAGATPPPNSSPAGGIIACNVPNVLTTLFLQALYCAAPGNPGVPPNTAAKDTRTASAWAACCTAVNAPTAPFNDYLSGVVSGQYSGQYVQSAISAVWRRTFITPCSAMYPTADARLATFVPNAIAPGDVVTDVTPPIDAFAIPLSSSAPAIPLGAGCRWLLTRTAPALPVGVFLVAYTNAVSFLYSPLLDPTYIMSIVIDGFPLEPITDLGLQAFYTPGSGGPCSGVIVVRTATSVLIIAGSTCVDGSIINGAISPEPIPNRAYLVRVARDIVTRFQQIPEN